MEFLVWLLGIVASNFLATVPLYLITSVIFNKFAKSNIDFKILSFNFAVLMSLMLWFEAFTIANTVTMFLENLLLIWMGNALYFRREFDNGGKSI